MRFMTRPLARAVNRAAAGIERLERTLEHVPATLAAIAERVGAIEHGVGKHLTHKRKTPTASTREAHIEAARALGGRCPFCDVDLFNEHGAFTGEVHHHDAASDARIEATMPTCGECNRSFNATPAPRALIEAYHFKRKRLNGALFSRKRTAA